MAWVPVFPLSAIRSVIPNPRSIQVEKELLPLSSLKTIAAPPKCRSTAENIRAMLAYFGLKIVWKDSRSADITLRLSRKSGDEGWRIAVSRKGIELTGTECGLFYASTALAQMVASASACGADAAQLSYGVVEDAPRFAWRGFLLDSARHFQTPSQVKAFIRLLGQYRINVLHWHLTDRQGWRIADAVGIPELADAHTLEDGQFTAEDIREIRQVARENFVRIVPELDMPGHSASLLSRFPEFACDPANPGREVCISKPAARQFLRKVLEKVMALFPESPYIHIGGDEASTAHWESCPSCRRALKRHGFTDMRELENFFMRDMAKFVLSRGRRPIVWCTNGQFPPDVCQQAWFDSSVVQMRERGDSNPIIYSAHTSCYFDYPATGGEPGFSWMIDKLPLEEVYNAEPLRAWGTANPTQLLGMEGCLWTELIPSWRIFQKMYPRLGAFAEAAWSMPLQRQLGKFQQRFRVLEEAGYGDYLRKMTGFLEG